MQYAKLDAQQLYHMSMNCLVSSVLIPDTIY